MYLRILDALDGLFEGESNFICNASNFSALIYNNLKNLNWVGFYMECSGSLLLGPFQGRPACIKIPHSKGVCGAAATKLQTILVEDVHDFPGHIACDVASQSEIVIPMIKDGVFYGVLDIDAPIKARFNEEDKINLEKALNKLLQASDMESIAKYYSGL